MMQMCGAMGHAPANPSTPVEVPTFVPFESEVVVEWFAKVRPDIPIADVRKALTEPAVTLMCGASYAAAYSKSIERHGRVLTAAEAHAEREKVG